MFIANRVPWKSEEFKAEGFQTRTIITALFDASPSSYFHTGQGLQPDAPEPHVAPSSIH